jgi:hypothetical protein
MHAAIPDQKKHRKNASCAHGRQEKWCAPSASSFEAPDKAGLRGARVTELLQHKGIILIAKLLRRMC